MAGPPPALPTVDQLRAAGLLRRYGITDAVSLLSSATRIKDRTRLLFPAAKFMALYAVFFNACSVVFIFILQSVGQPTPAREEMKQRSV
jgi:hypothetical protein